MDNSDVKCFAKLYCGPQEKNPAFYGSLENKWGNTCLITPFSWQTAFSAIVAKSDNWTKFDYTAH